MRSTGNRQAALDGEHRLVECAAHGCAGYGKYRESPAIARTGTLSLSQTGVGHERAADGSSICILMNALSRRVQLSAAALP